MLQHLIELLLTCLPLYFGRKRRSKRSREEAEKKKMKKRIKEEGKEKEKEEEEEWRKDDALREGENVRYSRAGNK